MLGVAARPAYRLPLSSLLLQRGLASQAKEKWHLVAAVCLERRPVLAPGLNPMEQSMVGQQAYFYYLLPLLLLILLLLQVNMLHTKETEISMLNDHEMKAKGDREREERKKAGQELMVLLLLFLLLLLLFPLLLSRRVKRRVL